MVGPTNPYLQPALKRFWFKYNLSMGFGALVHLGLGL